MNPKALDRANYYSNLILLIMAFIAFLFEPHFAWGLLIASLLKKSQLDLTTGSAQAKMLLVAAALILGGALWWILSFKAFAAFFVALILYFGLRMILYYVLEKK